MPKKIRVEDTSPYAKPTNNLTTEWDVPLTQRIVKESRRIGVDPYAGLAEFLKETLAGQRYMEHGQTHVNPDIASRNPLQYNAPHFNSYNDMLKAKARQHPAYMKALEDYNNYPTKASRKGLDKVFAETFKEVQQGENIKRGLEYLKKWIDERGLEGGFAKFRGRGEAAKYHGRHVKALYEMLKKNKDLQKLVENEGEGNE